MKHFLFEDKDYRYRVNFKRRREARDPVRELARMFRNRPRGGGGSFGKAGPGKDLRQRCTAKMQYSSSIEAHKVQLEKYLVREGTERDGSAAVLFGTDLEEYKQNMSGRNFRIFLSPESGKVNVKELAETFIDKLEKQTGYKFYWQGACHYNTAHPHAHLLINGVDKQGLEIKFPKDVVKTFMRETAKDICTNQIGGRTREDLEREQEAALHSPRYTKLDNRIRDISVDNRVGIQGSVYDRERLLIRLETLRKLNLCTYENGGYTLKNTWEEDLKSNGRYNTFLQARENLKFTDPSSMKIYTGEQGRITGKVTKIYRTDGDASDNHVVVLEGIDGKAYFVPLLKQPELHDKGNKSFLKEGELAAITTYQNQRGRLTPVIYKADVKAVLKEIKKNDLAGNLPSGILDGSETGKKQFGRS